MNDAISAGDATGCLVASVVNLDLSRRVREALIVDVGAPREINARIYLRRKVEEEEV